MQRPSASGNEAQSSTPIFPTVWRNLGIGYFNVRKNPAKARAAYDKAFAPIRGDGRVLYEHDQLWKRIGIARQSDCVNWKIIPHLVVRRDDLSVELCSLLNQAGRHERGTAALDLSAIPALGRRRRGTAWPAHPHPSNAGPAGAALNANIPSADEHFRTALSTPPNLGEAKHLLANQSDIHHWLGFALDSQAGTKHHARRHWTAAAKFKGDFQEMSVRTFSEMTYYSSLAWQCLGRKAKARRLLSEFAGVCSKLGQIPGHDRLFCHLIADNAVV